MKNATEVVSADLTGGDAQERKRRRLALILVLGGAGLVAISLCLDRSGGVAMGWRGLGCGLIGGGFARALVKPRSGPKATK